MSSLYIDARRPGLVISSAVVIEVCVCVSCQFFFGVNACNVRLCACVVCIQPLSVLERSGKA